MPDLFYKLQRLLCFSKGNPSNPLGIKHKVQFLGGRKLQNSTEATYVVLKNCDVYIQFEVAIGRKLGDALWSWNSC